MLVNVEINVIILMSCNARLRHEQSFSVRKCFLTVIVIMIAMRDFTSQFTGHADFVAFAISQSFKT